MYKVKVHRDVEKFLNKIPKRDAERIREKILSLKDPFAQKPKKVEGETDVFRIRVGKYRILFFIDEEMKTVVVSKVDRRERAYDRL
ncbi:MAG: type II toxin-antitoxin system RelE/ParE family toxin [Archaeoglobaceae archaeon]